MSREAFKAKLEKAVLERRNKRIAKYNKKEEFEMVQKTELAGDFADGTIDAMNQQIDDICIELPASKQQGSRMACLRETKRNIMVEEQMQQALVRKHEKNQTGLSLASGRAMDTFVNWMRDGNDRCYAHGVVAKTLKDK